MASRNTDPDFDGAMHSEHRAPDKKCSEPGCTATFRDHRWGQTKADDWFHQRNGDSWCPKHIPVWVESWRAKKAEPKPPNPEDYKFLPWPGDIDLSGLEEYQK